MASTTGKDRTKGYEKVFFGLAVSTVSLRWFLGQKGLGQKKTRTTGI